MDMGSLILIYSIQSFAFLSVWLSANCEQLHVALIFVNIIKECHHIFNVQFSEKLNSYF